MFPSVVVSMMCFMMKTITGPLAHMDVVMNGVWRINT